MQVFANGRGAKGEAGGKKIQHGDIKKTGKGKTTTKAITMEQLASAHVPAPAAVTARSEAVKILAHRERKSLAEEKRLKQELDRVKQELGIQRLTTQGLRNLKRCNLNDEMVNQIIANIQAHEKIEMMDLEKRIHSNFDSRAPFLTQRH